MGATGPQRDGAWTTGIGSDGRRRDARGDRARPLLAVLAGAIVLAACGGGGAAGGIGLACLTGPRQTADQRALCACIQGVADRSLSAADQRRVVPFFADPERAHRVRLSDTARDDAFWARYMAFVDQAEATCGPDGEDAT